MMLTTKEAAERLGIPVRTLQKWINDDRFPGAKKYGRDWLIPEADLEALERPKAGRPRGANYRPRKRPTKGDTP